MEPLHDDDDGSIAAVDTVSDGGLEVQVHSLSVVVGQSVCGLDGVINDNGSTKLPVVAFVLDCSGTKASYLSQG